MLSCVGFQEANSKNRSEFVGFAVCARANAPLVQERNQKQRRPTRFPPHMSLPMDPNMLATIILDSFTRDEANEIAQALDMICAPDDNYGFASACIYSFWSLPGQDVLYIGLAKDVARRFRQHVGLLSCDPACCKRGKIDNYFRTHDRLGFSIIVQSSLNQPATEADREQLAELYDDGFPACVTDINDGVENIIVAEGFMLNLHHQLGDKLPPWNEQHGSKRGHRLRSLVPLRDKIDMTVEIVRTGKSPEQIKREWAKRGPSYELLLNITGHELSDLNAKSTLRQIASDATVEGSSEKRVFCS